MDLGGETSSRPQPKLVQVDSPSRLRWAAAFSPWPFSDFGEKEVSSKAPKPMPAWVSHPSRWSVAQMDSLSRLRWAAAFSPWRFSGFGKKEVSSKAPKPRPAWVSHPSRWSVAQMDSLSRLRWAAPLSPWPYDPRQPGGRTLRRDALLLGRLLGPPPHHVFVRCIGSSYRHVGGSFSNGAGHRTWWALDERHRRDGRWQGRLGEPAATTDASASNGRATTDRAVHRGLLSDIDRLRFV